MAMTVTNILGLLKMITHTVTHSALCICSAGDLPATFPPFYRAQQTRSTQESRCHAALVFPRHTLGIPTSRAAGDPAGHLLPAPLTLLCRSRRPRPVEEPHFHDHGQNESEELVSSLEPTWRWRDRAKLWVNERLMRWGWGPS